MLKDTASVICVWLLGSLATFPNSVGAEEGASPCDKLIDHGLRNIENKLSSRTAKTRLLHDVCSEKYQSSSTNGKKRLSLGIAKLKLDFGFGSDTNSEAEFQDKYCSSVERESFISDFEASQSATFYAQALSSWERCLELTQKELMIDPDIRLGGRVVNFGLRYTGATEGMKFSGIRVSPAGSFNCTDESGNIVTESTTAVITQKAVIISCERTTQEMNHQGELLEIAPAAVITLKTGQGPYALEFPAYSDPVISKDKIQEFEEKVEALDKGVNSIGSIVASAVNPAVFANLTGSPPDFDPIEASWVPADGRSIRGSKLHSLAGFENVPDLRGIFLRGLNEFMLGSVRSDKYQDPEEGRKVGSTPGRQPRQA